MKDIESGTLNMVGFSFHEPTYLLLRDRNAAVLIGLFLDLAKLENAHIVDGRFYFNGSTSIMSEYICMAKSTYLKRLTKLESAGLIKRHRDLGDFIFSIAI